MKELISERPKAIVMIGMAGSGKTTFTNRYYEKLTVEENKKVYCLNLDPAVLSVPYPVNIDIRDTVNYKEVMKQYKLGPNGAIMTSLNLFATKFDQVIKLMEQRSEYDYFLIDTPGQIEVFNWSASGTIILQILSSLFPTYIMFITDTSRCINPISFTSTMLYCSSVLYKSNLPLLCVFNKTDVTKSEEMVAWMSDYDKYVDASFAAEQGDESYMSSLSRSSALAMMQFYEDIDHTSVSSATGDGFSDLIKKVDGLLPAFMEIHQQRLQMVEEKTKKHEEEQNE